MKIPKAGIVRRPRELDAFCRTVVQRLNDLEAFHPPVGGEAEAAVLEPETEPQPETAK